MSMWKKIKNYFSSETHNQSLPICQICMNHMGENTTVQLCDCQHTYCYDCIYQYVHSKIKAYEVIKCLDESCAAELNQTGQFYLSLPLEQKQKYQKIKRFYFVSKNPDFKLCPKETCIGLVNTKKKPCSCSQCSQKYCPKCLYKEHWGRCDKESVVHLQNDLKYIQCTHCNFIIEKNDGCDHITCKCGYQLCYKCGGVWKGPQHLCVRSKGFQMIRYGLVGFGQKLNFVTQNHYFRKVTSGLGKALINSFYANLVIALILTCLQIIYKMASFFLPINYIFGYFRSKQVTEEPLAEQEDEFPYFKLYLFLVLVSWLVVRKWVPKLQTNHFIMAIGLITAAFYIASNLFLIYYYEYLVILFFIEHITIVISFIVGFGLFLVMINGDWRGILETGVEKIKDIHFKLRFGHSRMRNTYS